MIIQYCSDLHLEFKENKDFLKQHPIIPKGEILILAGDIMLFRDLDKHKDFFDFVADNFAAVYWIPGNHEYYYSDAAQKSGTFCEKIRSNVYLLNNYVELYKGFRFVFSTLWSHISPVNQCAIQQSMSDFMVIKYKKARFSSIQYNHLFEDNRKFLAKVLSEKEGDKTIVVTHHVPTFLNYPEKYKGDVLSEAFAVELFDFIEANVPDYWIYGHHHNNTPDFSIGVTQMLTNQLGYVAYGEHANFKSDKTFTI